MNIITIFDTSVATQNIGDQIIVDAVRDQLSELFEFQTMFLSVPTHEVISRYSRRIINKSLYSFVAGTNLLTSKFHFLRANQWNINLYDAMKFNRVILLGVGWTDYQSKPNILSKIIYKHGLDSTLLHSVRDSYTKSMLESIGVKNVINTGCPTMWKLTAEHCANIPKNKAENVVMTLTDYRRDIDSDKKLISILKNNYKNVYFWIQGSEDAEYIKTLSKDVLLINPTLESYNTLLDSTVDLDYVGTRLHAGIRAMQKGKRSVIIGVDNRAIEKKKDYNLNVIKRNEIDSLEIVINSRLDTNITLNIEGINKWKNQFKEIVNYE